MAKSYSLAFVTIFLLTLGSCQSLEQISIDYLQPADLSFHVALVHIHGDAVGTEVHVGILHVGVSVSIIAHTLLP